MSTISAKDYISWVQRSLNRLVPASLTVDGADTPTYREYVKTYQARCGRPQNGIVDAPLQNKVIKANHKDRAYGDWVRAALIKTGAGYDLAPTGVIDNATRTSLKCFQAYNNLKDDGWVGAKTETVLFQESKITPPGHISPVKPTPPPPPKPSPKPVDPSDTIDTEKLFDILCKQIELEIKLAPSTYPNVDQRNRLKCMLNKLRNPSGKDFDYQLARYVTRYIHGTDFSFTKGYTPDDLASDARKDLMKKVQRNKGLDGGKQYEKFKQNLLWLYYDIEAGLGEIARQYGLHGDSNYGAQAMNRWGMNKQKRANSILSCFA